MSWFKPRPLAPRVQAVIDLLQRDDVSWRLGTDEERGHNDWALVGPAAIMVTSYDTCRAGVVTQIEIGTDDLGYLPDREEAALAAAARTVHWNLMRPERQQARMEREAKERRIDRALEAAAD